MENEVFFETSRPETEEDEVFFETSRPETEEDEVLSETSTQETEEDEELSETSTSETGEDEVLSETSTPEAEEDQLLSNKTDWILVERFSEDGVAVHECRLCAEAIIVPYYKHGYGYYNRTEIFVHKACGDLPMEMEHQLLHPGHTLRKTVRRRDHGTAQFCNSCNDDELLGYVYYKCSECEDFVLDIKCALKLFPIKHKCHQHPVIPNHKKEFFHCVCCNLDHYGTSFECMTCPSFRIQQYCASRTQKLAIHRHDLELVYSPLPENRHSFGDPVHCQACRQELKAEEMCVSYHCARCRYYFHVKECKTSEHFIEGYPMVLVEEEGAHAESASAICHGCRLKISVPYYITSHRVSREKQFLHKVCAQLPESAENHLHPGHELTLGNYKQICDACDAPWEGLSYSCPRASCRFSIDIICAFKNVYSQHKFHKHPLITSQIKAPLACRACNIDSDGPSYQCTTCRFWVHQQCGSAPMSKEHYMHPHLLKLTYSVQDSALDDGSRKFHCHVCREEMEPHDWAYHCAGCRYYIHAHDCSEPPWNREIEEFDYEEALAAAVHLPNESTSFATLFFMKPNQEEGRESKPGTQDANSIKSRKMLYLDPYETCRRCAEFLAPPCNVSRPGFP